MMPFFGPSTLRDAPGLLVDGYFDYAGSHYIDHVPTRNTVMGIDTLNKRANLFEGESLMLGDRYVFIRDAYLQRREYDINDGEVSEDSFGGDSFDSGSW
jgi:phospholipid-binding lipoprotein MlaA